jgi:K+-sensing histidine kinase KdpD
MADAKAGQEMHTFFAPSGRAQDGELQLDIDFASNNPIISGLLTSVGGLIAVLNDQRQIISLNTAFLEMLGLDDGIKALGLRPGEAVDCVHAHDEPGGCGTSRYCSTCGAAIAIVACLDQDAPAERRCALTVKREGVEVEMALQVQASPIRVNGRRYVLLFVKDITREEHRAALERTFFHDVNNMLSMLVQASELLIDENPSTLSTAIYDASLRLSSEVAMQRCLFEAESCSYLPRWRENDAGRILQELRVFFSSHQAARGRNLQFPDSYQRVPLKTDGSALFRVLLNMIVNALEATPSGGTVKVWIEQEGELPTFCVWNEAVIPEDVALRIFQRSFSTKDGAGRGIGTYSMRLFGEKILGGRVWFTSEEGKGTIFRLAHPVVQPKRGKVN